MKLKDKYAIVTGSSKGIGRAIALELVSQGASVVINGTHEAALQELQHDISAQGGKCEYVVGSVADPDVAQQLADTCITAYGSIDILVNNAGVNSRFSFLDLEFAEWQRMIDINLNSVFHACKAVLPYMIQQRSGSIINMSSAASKTAHANASASYGVSKAGINSLTQKLAYEMAAYGVRVNAVCPGPIETDMSLQWTEEYRANVIKKIPLGRLGRPEDVAKPVAFLASDDASFITGELININGGTYFN